MELTPKLILFMSADVVGFTVYKNRQVKREHVHPWLAGFPVINTEIVSSDMSQKTSSDFIGPTIDCGFRLTKLASIERFAISLELAYALVETMEHEEFEKAFSGIFFEGQYELKGVLGGRPYPGFWIHMDDWKEDLHLKMLGKKRIQRETLISYCEKYIDEVNDPLAMCIPYFLSGNRTNNWNENRQSEQHLEVLEKMRIKDSYRPEETQGKEGKFPIIRKTDRES